MTWSDWTSLSLRLSLSPFWGMDGQQRDCRVGRMYRDPSQVPCASHQGFLWELAFAWDCRGERESEGTHLCPTLCDPMGSTVHGILQGRTLERVAFPFSRGSFPTQRLNPSLPHCRRILHQLSHKGSPRISGSPALQEDSLPAELSGKPLLARTFVGKRSLLTSSWFSLCCHSCKPQLSISPQTAMRSRRSSPHVFIT